jgi:hypothetical protein
MQMPKETSRQRMEIYTERKSIRVCGLELVVIHKCLHVLKHVSCQRKTIYFNIWYICFMHVAVLAFKGVMVHYTQLHLQAFDPKTCMA